MFVALAAILYVIALAMIGVGGYVAADGSQMLTIDRGVAYYIGGMSMVSAGAVLLGVATLVLCFGALNRSLKQARMPAVVHGDAAVAGSDTTFPIIAAATPVAAGLAGAEMAHERIDERQRDMFEEHGSASEALSPVSAIDDIDAALESVRQQNYTSYAPEVPAQKPEEELEEVPIIEPIAAEFGGGVRKSAFEYSSHMASDQLFSGSEPAENGEEEAQPLSDDTTYFGLSSQPARTIAEKEPVDESETPAVAVDEPAQISTPTVVGTYESGGNRYVMYSDGSIDAHLPSGVRTFLSLDELKQFVSSSAAG